MASRPAGLGVTRIRLVSGRWLLQRAQQGVLRLLVQPLGIGHHGSPAAGLAGTQAQRALQGADLADADPGVVGAALDPDEVGVVAHVAEQRALLAGAVESDLVARRGPAARVASLARRLGAGARAGEAPREAQGGLSRRITGASKEVGRMDPVGLEGPGESRPGGEDSVHGRASLAAGGKPGASPAGAVTPLTKPLSPLKLGHPAADGVLIPDRRGPWLSDEDGLLMISPRSRWRRRPRRPHPPAARMAAD